MEDNIRIMLGFAGVSGAQIQNQLVRLNDPCVVFGVGVGGVGFEEVRYDPFILAIAGEDRDASTFLIVPFAVMALKRELCLLDRVKTPRASENIRKPPIPLSRRNDPYKAFNPCRKLVKQDLRFIPLGFYDDIDSLAFQ